MLKRLADWLFLIAHRQTRWRHEEEIRRDFLERGYVRGQAAMRTGLKFDFYLMRADIDPAQSPIAEAMRRSQAGAGIAPSGPPRYRWWAVMDESGRECCLGPLEELPIERALEKYLGLLDEETRKLIGG